MGATNSQPIREHLEEDTWWTPRNQDQRHCRTDSSTSAQESLEFCIKEEATASEDQLDKVTGSYKNEDKHKEMEEFRKELSVKRKARQEMISARVIEMQKLKKELNKATEQNKDLAKDNQQMKELLAKDNIDVNSLVRVDEHDRIVSQNRRLMSELAEVQLALQQTNSELLAVTDERNELEKHISTHKEVARVTKHMLEIREDQLVKLKVKLSEIESSLADTELQTLSVDLRTEYERQLTNIRNLRALYEERARAAAQEKQNLVAQVMEFKTMVDVEVKKAKELEERVDTLEQDLSKKDSELRDSESQLGLSKAEARGLQAEMNAINQLFSQILLCGRSQDIDMDRLVVLLKENHGLLSDIAGEEGSELASALPRLLLDLVSQAETQEKTDNTANEEDKEAKAVDNESNEDCKDGETTVVHTEAVDVQVICEPASPTVTSAEEIVSKLPKVWRVLMELLSHQTYAAETEIDEEQPESERPEGTTIVQGSRCYNSVQTPNGPKLQLSVSKTYIRLKDLILEKKSLQKELSKLKTLNNHLETRLTSQERRLDLVSTELSHTWCLVGRMQRTHKALHTHEQILRYELQQKRELLNELKKELEYCRQNWQEARKKNNKSEMDFKKLRSEMSSRKKITLDYLHQSGSGESGYSDEREGNSSDDEDVRVTKRGSKGNVFNTSDISETTVEDGQAGGNCISVVEDGIGQATQVIGEDTSIKNETHAEACTNLAIQIITSEERCSSTEDSTTPKQIEETPHASNTRQLQTVEPSNELVVISTSEEALVDVNKNNIDESLDLSIQINTTSEESYPATEDTVTLKQIEEFPHEHCSGLVADKQIVEDPDNLVVIRSTEEIQHTVSVIENVAEKSSSLPMQVNTNEESSSTVVENILERREIEERRPSTNILSKEMSEIKNDAIKSTFLNPITTISSIIKQVVNVEDFLNDIVAIEAIPGSSCSTVLDDAGQLSTHEIVSQGIIKETVPGSEIVFATEENMPSTSNEESAPLVSNNLESTDAIVKSPTRTPEEILAAREARLKRLEEQCSLLVKKVSNTSTRGVALCSRLEELHDQYGSSDISRSSSGNQVSNIGMNKDGDENTSEVIESEGSSSSPCVAISSEVVEGNGAVVSTDDVCENNISNM